MLDHSLETPDAGWAPAHQEVDDKREYKAEQGANGIFHLVHQLGEPGWNEITNYPVAPMQDSYLLLQVHGGQLQQNHSTALSSPCLLPCYQPCLQELDGTIHDPEGEQMDAVNGTCRSKSRNHGITRVGENTWWCLKTQMQTHQEKAPWFLNCPCRAKTINKIHTYN